MPYCSDCGEPIEASDRFCPECGADLSDGEFGRNQDDHARDHSERHDDRRGRRDDRGRQDERGDDWDRHERRRGRRDGWEESDGRREGRDDWEGHGTPDGRPPRDPGGDIAQSGPGDTYGGLLGFCLKYPSRAGIGGLLGGALVLLFFWLIIPLFLAVGYFVRLTAAAAAGRPKPPAWDDFGGMIKDGFVLVIAVLPLLIVFGIVQFGIDQVNPFLTWPVSLVIGYIFPAIWITYAIERRWQAVYDVSTLVDLMTTERYLVAYIIYALLINGVGLFVVLILMVLSVFTIVGWIILWPLIIFYWYAIDGSLWGGVYYQMHGPADIPDPDPDARPPETRPNERGQY